MTNATALPATLTSPSAPAMTAAQPLEGSLLPSFASLMGAVAVPDEGALDGIDELPPEAMALLLAALAGTQAAANAAANKIALPVTGAARAVDAASAKGGVPPAVGEAAGDAAAHALESVLRDLQIPDSPEAGGAVHAEGPARAEAPPLREALTWVPNAIDVSASRPSTHEPGPRHAAPIQTPVGAHGWSDELAGSIAWIAQKDLQSASIRLSPEHLGPLDVQISVRDGDAVVSFAASHAETRAALEQALPRLRELLASQGLALAHANVSEHAARQDRPPSSRLLAAAGEDAELIHEGGARLPAGLVDLYA